MTKSTNISYKNGSSVRVSTQEIDNAVEQLQYAYCEGRLNETELGERTATALAAKTESDLAIILDDLKGGNFPLVASTRKLQRLNNTTRAIFSGVEQNGRFILPKNYRISAIMGGCLIDLTKASLESPESTIHILAIMGGVQIFVPPGLRVNIHSSPILGGVSKKLSDENLPEDAPTITIFAKAIMGGIEILTRQAD